jgi:hypothetical protein
MYHAHATWEDTVIFPTWRKLQSKSRLGELGKKFDEMEHQHFGKDGFEDGIERMTRVEEMLGFADLNTYTAPTAPRSLKRARSKRLHNGSPAEHCCAALGAPRQDGYGSKSRRSGCAQREYGVPLPAEEMVQSR